MPPLRSTKLEFASVLSYVPREGGGDLGDQSRDVMRILKDGRMIGSTLLGCANKLLESYPSSLIRGFAVMRAVSNPLDFKQTLDPIVGAITLHSDGRCHRKP